LKTFAPIPVTTECSCQVSPDDQYGSFDRFALKVCTKQCVFHSGVFDTMKIDDIFKDRLGEERSVWYKEGIDPCSFVKSWHLFARAIRSIMISPPKIDTLPFCIAQAVCNVDSTSWMALQLYSAQLTIGFFSKVTFQLKQTFKGKNSNSYWGIWTIIKDLYTHSTAGYTYSWNIKIFSWPSVSLQRYKHVTLVFYSTYMCPSNPGGYSPISGI